MTTDAKTLAELKTLGQRLAAFTGALAVTNSSVAPFSKELEDAAVAATSQSTPALDVVVHTSAMVDLTSAIAEAVLAMSAPLQALIAQTMITNDAAKAAASSRPIVVLPAGVTVAGGKARINVRYRGPLPFGKGVRSQLHLLDPKAPAKPLNFDFEIDKAAKEVLNDITTFPREVDVSKLAPGTYQVGAKLFSIAPGPTYPDWGGQVRDPEVMTQGAHWIVGEAKVEAGAPAPGPAPGPAPVRDILVYPFPGTFWQAKLPKGTKEFGPTDARTAAIRNLKMGKGFEVNRKQWTQGPTRAKASDPKLPILVSAQWVDPNQAGWRPQTWRDLPIPARLEADSGYSDAHAIVAYPPGVLPDFPEGAFLDLWQARKEGGGTSWRASAGVLYSAAGDGLNFSQMHGGQRHDPPKVRNAGWGACRAYGGTARGGLIVADELTRGVEHLIMLSLPPEITCDGWCRAPATKDEKQGMNQVQIPMGAFFRLPAGFNLDALGLRSPEGRSLAIGARDYGFVVLDCSETRAINTDRSDPITVAAADRLAASGDWARIGAQLVYAEHPDFTRIYR